MSKRIAVASFQIESNSLTAIKTERGNFSISTGEEMLARIDVTDYLQENGCTIIPTVYANAVPGGPVIREEFESIMQDILDAMPCRGEVDGVWLFLHGAMDVEGLGSGDLEITKRVREKAGNVPIAIAFDMHADIDPEITKYANIVCGFRTAPHEDIERTELHAASLLLKCIENNWMPQPVVVKVPIIASGDSMTTDVYPGKELVEELWEMEKTDESLCISLFLGNPWVDALCAGGAVVVTPYPGREEAAKAQALKLAGSFWKVRGEFRFRAKNLEERAGLSWAMEKTERPLFLTDTGDNVSGGGSGDNAYILQLFEEMDIRGAAFYGLADAPAVEAFETCSEGDALGINLGGTLDPASIRISARAVLKKKGTVMAWPARNDIPAVLLDINGNDVLVTKERTPIVHMKVFRDFGTDPSDYRFVILKLGYLWPEMYSITADSMMLLTPGSTCEVVERCVFHNIPRPVFPLDREMEWEPEIYENR